MLSLIARIGARLLQGVALAYCSLTPDVRRSYNQKPVPSEGENLFRSNGPQAVERYSFDGIDVFYPAKAKAGGYPLVAMVNGTGIKACSYRPIFEHLASWGFVVAGNDDTYSWSGEKTAAMIERVLEMANDGGILSGKIDTDKIGVAGHSQGSIGAINTLSLCERIKCLVIASVPNKWLADKLRWPYSVSDIRVPTFLAAGTRPFERFISPLSSVKSLSQSFPLNTPLACGILSRVEHRFVLHESDAYLTAWFRLWFYDDARARKIFVGDEAEILHNPRWQNCSTKIPQ